MWVETGGTNIGDFRVKRPSFIVFFFCLHMESACFRGHVDNSELIPHQHFIPSNLCRLLNLRLLFTIQF